MTCGHCGATIPRDAKIWRPEGGWEWRCPGCGGVKRVMLGTLNSSGKGTMLAGFPTEAMERDQNGRLRRRPFQSATMCKEPSDA